MSYQRECEQAAAAFSRFLRDLESQGMEFHGNTDAQLAAILAASVKDCAAPFEALFTMIERGFRERQAA